MDGCWRSGHVSTQCAATRRVPAPQQAAGRVAFHSVSDCALVIASVHALPTDGGFDGVRPVWTRTGPSPGTVRVKTTSCDAPDGPASAVLPAEVATSHRMCGETDSGTNQQYETPLV